MVVTLAVLHVGSCFKGTCTFFEMCAAYTCEAGVRRGMTLRAAGDAAMLCLERERDHCPRSRAGGATTTCPSMTSCKVGSSRTGQ